MADPFVAEIRVVGFNYPPKGWAYCNGQLMPISQNTALFALLGTVYGGDGKSTFGIPNIQGNVVVGAGQSNTGNGYPSGTESGSRFVTLLQSEMPVHTHRVQASADPGEQLSPAQNTTLARSNPDNAWQSNTSANLQPMAPQALAPAGGSVPHNNMMPTVALNFVIALQGVFPPRQ